MQEIHDSGRRNLTQIVVNLRYSPFLPTDGKQSSQQVMNVLTNLGNNYLAPGPLRHRSGYVCGLNNIGGIMISPMGQVDGSVTISTMGHKTSFSSHFLEVYQQLLLRVLDLSSKRDVTRDELIKLPEYKELLHILRP